MTPSALLPQPTAKDVRYFFYSQAFADGFRATAAILLPALIGSYFGHFDTGLTISLGAMCVSLTDAPGPILNRRNSMLIAAALAFFTTILTLLLRTNDYLLGAEVAAVTFFFSMFVVYGARATAVGNTAILIMILTMDREVPQSEVLSHAALILLGGLFYFLMSILLYRLRPYRAAQRVLGECIREIAAYLSIRADFYNPAVDLDDNYRRMVAQQVTVNERQDQVRDLFFKTRRIVEESTEESRRLVFAFVETVDLFENITTAYYDYRSLRQLFGNSGALGLVHDVLKRIAVEISAVGTAIQSNTRFRKSFDYDGEIRRLKSAIDAVPMESDASRMVLKRMAVNIRSLLADLDNIEQYFQNGIQRKRTGMDHSHFVTHQPLDPKIFRDNLKPASSAFRHAVRVCLACVAGFLITKTFQYGAHSYWILLTIAFIIKPAYSLTKERNIQRLIGTLIGGAVGVTLLLLIQNGTALFIIMVALMIATYSLMRIHYLGMVLCMTPYILILFSFLGTAFRAAATERILDTAVGCTLAFLASHFLFPNWEAEQIKANMQGIIKANARYLRILVEALSGQKVSVLEYKLARKEVYLQSANLSAAFQRMLSEPKEKQSPQSQMQQFVVLNHILFSNVATLATTLLGKEAKAHRPELVQLAQNAYTKLEESCDNLGDAEKLTAAALPQASSAPLAPDDGLMREQLRFIYGVSKDIQKLTASF